MPDDFARLQRIFLNAAELPPFDRSAFLDHACGDDRELRRRVELMLDADGSEASLSGTDFVTGSSALPDLPAEFGGFRILRRLGAGGMGVVYEAEQRLPRRRVAIKVLRPGYVSEAAKTRFRREIGALAALSHPGIARIHEAGEQEIDGDVHPYFVMELVEGVDLLTYAERERLRSNQRLELIARVADAVHHAHMRGVIHRDLKPGNVLVIKEDGADAPKVLDFGVARITEGDSQAITLQTTPGQIVGTIAYMSPEQASGDPTRVDARTDVWALGVLLFELLTGRLPFDIRNRPIHDAIRAVCESEPIRAGAIDRSLRGDIETILATALATDPDRRYQSAHALAADVRHQLAGEPIAARPDSRVYQLGKFAERNRAIVGGTLATLIVLIAGVVVATSFAMSERAQREVAETNLRRANAVRGFLVDMLQQANPRVNTDRKSMTVPDLLDIASVDIDENFSDDPAVAMELNLTLGRAYLAAAEFERAQSRLLAGLSFAETVGDQSELAATHDELARLFAATGELDDAESHARKANDIFRSLDPPDIGLQAGAYATLADILHSQGDLEASRRQYQSGLDLAAGVLDDVHPAVRRLRNGVAIVAYTLNNLDDAIAPMTKNVEAARLVDGERSATYLEAIINLGAVLRAAGRLDEAEPYYETAYELSRDIYDPGHPLIAVATNNYGRLLQARGRYAEAAGYVRESLEIRRSLLPPNHPDIVHSERILGYLHFEAGNLDAAEPLLREGVERTRKAFGEQHIQTVNAARDYARLLQALERFEEASEMAAYAISVAPAPLREDAVMTGALHNLLGQTLLATGRSDEAEASFIEAIETLSAEKERGRPTLVDAHTNLVTIYTERGDIERATLHQRTVDSFER